MKVSWKAQRGFFSGSVSPGSVAFLRLGSVYMPMTFFLTVSGSSERKMALLRDLDILRSWPVSAEGPPVPTRRLTRPSLGWMMGNSAAGFDEVFVFGVGVDAVVLMVELAGDFAAELEVGDLVFADGDESRGGRRGCRRDWPTA